MGTRSTITFMDEENKKPICTIYQQFDGYIDGVGKELAEWLSKYTLVNGLNSKQPLPKANGMGCLASQFIKKFKTEEGGLYLTYLDNKQEYNYVVYGKGNFYDWSKPVDFKLRIKVDDIFDGTPEELLQFDEDAYWESKE